MNSPTEDVKGLLIAANVVKEPNMIGEAWPCFIGSEPDGSQGMHDVVTLYDIPGGEPNPKWLLDYPRFMVRVRARDYPEGYRKAEEIKGVLLGLPSQDINDIRYVGVWIVVDTHFLKADDKGRSIFVSTWRCIREPNEGLHRQPL